MLAPGEDVRDFGDALLAKGLVSEAQLTEALGEIDGGGIGGLSEVLSRRGIVDEKTLLGVLASQLKVPFIDISHWPVPESGAKSLSELQARRNRALVLIDDPDRPTVGMVDPDDFEAKERLERAIKRPFRVALISGSLLADAFGRVYSKDYEIAQLADEVSEEVGARTLTLDPIAPNEDSSAAVVRLVDSVFADAVRMNASDIHVQPERDRLLLRYRVDGVLQEQILREHRVSAALVSRLKLMANLDIAEKRLPQDGRLSLVAHGQQVNVRVATMPSPYGETVVMRLLYQGGALRELDMLGLPEDILAYLKVDIRRPNGMILVTGPTGSGKTTTLYAALSEINEAGRKIITVEDPIEYMLPRISQVQINPRAGLHFADVLRATLRHDPDIIMVGEMRDTETLDIGMRAAMTGHLVFSTLHTRNAIATVNRLVDMGAQPYMIASVVNTVISQQLIRRICDTCRWPDALTESESRFIDVVAPNRLDGVEITRGTGCVRCQETGYLGRVALHEMLRIDATLAEAMRSGEMQHFAETARKQQGYRSMLDRGLDAVARGETTVSEVMRVSEEVSVLAVNQAGSES